MPDTRNPTDFIPTKQQAALSTILDCVSAKKIQHDYLVGSIEIPTDWDKGYRVAVQEILMVLQADFPWTVIETDLRDGLVVSGARSRNHVVEYCHSRAHATRAAAAREQAHTSTLELEAPRAFLHRAVPNPAYMEKRHAAQE